MRNKTKTGACMKIGILGSRGIPNHYGGFEQFAQYLSAGLVEKGENVWVYCSSSHPWQEKIWNGVNLIRCKDPEDKIGTAGQFIYDLNCILDSRKRNFDIIYQLGYTSSAVWYRLLPKGPIVVTNMDGLEWKRNKYSGPVRKFLKYAEKLAVTKSNLLIADSEAIQDYLWNEYETKSRFLPYGADVFNHPDKEKIENLNLIPYEYYLLIARLQPDNHIEEIIKGIKGSETKAPLLIVGNTNNAFGKYLKQTYESEIIRFMGGIFDTNLLDQLRYFSGLYFHGHSAGGTNPSLLEAMAARALICAHDNPFNSAVLENNAFYFSKPQDISLLINSSIRKTEDHPFIIKNIERIQKKYSWPKIIDDYHSLFKSLNTI